jgi:1-aminocyclopropane-1-carboxylate deaminase/D-cysteine desulfhydrase-like pyridoxal-dependent ACC family enzyme
LEALFGATVHWTAGADREEREERVATVTEGLRADGRRPYVIEVGGSGPIGAFGQVQAAREALAQWRAAETEPAVLLLPSAATGGTQAGLLAGLAVGGSATGVIGIAVARPPDELRMAIEATLIGLTHLTGVSVDPDAISIDAGQLGPGYGRATAEAAEAAALLGRTEAVVVDPIYTAKGLAGLIAGVREGRWDGRSVVFWHAGGTLGLFEPID